MPTQQDDLVVQFVLSMLPERLISAYQMLAKLNYPIKDQRSLTNQLDKIMAGDNATDKPEKSVIDLIRWSLEPVDFPIETPQSGLEKFHAQISEKFDFSETEDGEFVDRPDIVEIYERTFGPICAEEAIEAYSERRRAGWSELRAALAGHMAGWQCQRNLAWMLRETLRRHREPRHWPRF
jgi:hypothetical protein